MPPGYEVTQFAVMVLSVTAVYAAELRVPAFAGDEKSANASPKAARTADGLNARRLFSFVTGSGYRESVRQLMLSITPY